MRVLDRDEVIDDKVRWRNGESGGSKDVRGGEEQEDRRWKGGIRVKKRNKEQEMVGMRCHFYINYILLQLSLIDLGFLK